MVAILSDRAKVIMKSGLALSARSILWWTAKSNHGIPQTQYSNKRGWEKRFESSSFTDVRFVWTLAFTGVTRSRKGSLLDFTLRALPSLLPWRGNYGWNFQERCTI